MKWRKRSGLSLARFPKSAILQIVHEGMVAMQGVNLGKMVPVAVVDTSSRPDIRDVLRAHEDTPAGDCVTQWGLSKSSKDEAFLVLHFERPVETTAALVFPLEDWAGFVDVAIHSEIVGIRSGPPGVKTLDTGEPGITLSVPSDLFADTWERTYHDFVFRQLRGMGLSRKQAREGTSEMIREHRKLAQFQFPS